MSKVLKVAALVVGTVASIALIASGVGAPIGTGLLGVTWATIAAGAGLIGAVANLFSKKAAVPSEARDRLFATLDPNAPRKIVFGPTAMATDVRYQAYTGTNQEFLHWIVCVAAHEVESIDEIWFESEKAWSASGGVTSKYTGYLTITPRLVGTSDNGIAIDGVWTSSSTLTGCAYFHARFKLTGNDKKAGGPFASAVPSRVTVRGKGAKLLDPRLSTTLGGSGSQTITQSTWTYGSGGDNPALQLLFYYLGWSINGKLSVGRGLPVARLDMASFIAAANMCDEAVALAAGGTEPRYRSAGVFSEGDDPGTVRQNLLNAMNAVLRDDGGRISLHILHNDLSDPDALHFSEDDILGDESWRQAPSIEQTFNIVRGRYTDAGDTGLYQLAEAPEVELESFDGIDRIDTFDLACVQSASQWQRLAKQRLQRAQYAGVYSATFNARAWGTAVGRPVRLSHAGLGWSNKLFRVVGQGIRMDGRVPLVLQEEHESIYAWDEDEAPAVTSAEPTVYDPILSPIVQAIIESGQGRFRGEWAPDNAYAVDDLFLYDGATYRVLTAHTSDAGDPPPNGDVEAMPGGGEAALSGLLSNESHTVAADAEGAVVSYAGAEGQFAVYYGTADATGDCTFAIPSGGNPQGLTGPFSGSPLDTATGAYEVTGGLGDDEDSATLTIVATHGPSEAEIEKVFSLVKSKQGSDGSPAKMMFLASSHQTVRYDADGDPIAQTITFTPTKQNTAADTEYRLRKMDGTITGTITPGDSIGTGFSWSGDNLLISEVGFDGYTDYWDSPTGMIVEAFFSDGGEFADRISIAKIQDGEAGAPGDPGSPGADGAPGVDGIDGVDGEGAIMGWLSNATHTVATASDGSGANLSTAGGTFKVYQGLTDVSASASYSVVSETGIDVTINASSGVYTVDSISADTGTAVLRATYGTTEINLTYSIAKSKGGAPGDDGEPGVDGAPGEDGAPGPGGPVISLEPSEGAFLFVDQMAVNPSQSITLTATRQNTSETVTFSTSPTVTLTGTGLTRALSIADFGTNRQVVVTATGDTTGATDSVVLYRLERSTAEGGSTLGENLLWNGSLAAGTAGWTVTNGARIAGVTGDPAPYVFSKTSGTYLQAITGLLPLPPGGDELFLSFRFKGLSGNSAQAVVNFYDATGTYISQASPVKAITSSNWELVETRVARPAGASFYLVDCYGYENGITTATMKIGSFRMSTVQQGADVTSVITGAAPVEIDADHTGAITATLPRTTAFKLSRNGVDVTAGASWSVSTVSGTIGVSIVGGVLSVSSLGSSEAKVKLQAVYGGTAAVLEVIVRKKLAPPPSGGGGSGGSGGFASDSTITAASSTSYGSANAGPMIVTAGSGGTVTLTAPLSFESDHWETTTAGSAGKWQWCTVGGTPADVDTEDTSFQDTDRVEMYGEPVTTLMGNISVEAVKTGLTPGVDYEFRLLLRKTSGDGNLSFFGTASAQGS